MWILVNVYMITESELFVFIWRLFLHLSVFIWFVFQLLRLRNSFTNTVYQLSNRIEILLIGLLIVSIIFCTIGISLWTSYLNGKHSGNNNIFYATADINSFQDGKLYYFGSILMVANYTACAILVTLISYLFCNKLLKLTITIRHSYINTTLDKFNGDDLSQQQIKLLNVIAKQALLNFYPSLWGIWQACATVVSWVYTDEMILIIISVFCVIFEVLCIFSLWLSFVFANKEYMIICGCCHTKFLSAFERIAVKSIHSQSRYSHHDDYAQNTESPYHEMNDL